MDTTIVSALIAALVALIGSTISFIANRRVLRTEIKKVEMELARRFTEKLYEKRLAAYPLAFEITDDLREKKLRRESTTQQYLEQILQSLLEWHRKNGLILSPETILAYKNMRDAIDLVITSSAIPLSQESLLTIRDSKVKFRTCMRKDLNLLYAEEKDDYLPKTTIKTKIQNNESN